MLEIYALVAAGVILGQLAPGPNLLAVAQTALGSGRRAALAVALGVAVVVFFWVSVAALGLAALIEALPVMRTVMMVVGGAYLISLGAKAIVRAIRADAPSLEAAEPSAVRDGFWRGVFVNLTNVKSAAMWTAVASTLYGAGATAAGALVLAPIGALSALAIYAFYAVVFSSAPARRVYGRLWRGFEAGFGAVFGLVGARFMAEALGRSAASP